MEHKRALSSSWFRCSRNVSDGLQRRRTKNKQTRVGVLLELGDPNRMVAKEFLDYAEREVAPLDMNQPGWRTGLAEHRYEIGICSHHGIAILFRPIPDRPVVRLPEVNITHMGQAGEQRCQARNQSWSEVLVEKQAQTRFARRPASAANW